MEEFFGNPSSQEIPKPVFMNQSQLPFSDHRPQIRLVPKDERRDLTVPIQALVQHLSPPHLVGNHGGGGLPPPLAEHFPPHPLLVGNHGGLPPQLFNGHFPIRLAKPPANHGGGPLPPPPTPYFPPPQHVGNHPFRNHGREGGPVSLLPQGQPIPLKLHHGHIHHPALNPDEIHRIFVESPKPETHDDTKDKEIENLKANLQKEKDDLSKFTHKYKRAEENRGRLLKLLAEEAEKVKTLQTSLRVVRSQHTNSEFHRNQSIEIQKKLDAANTDLTETKNAIQKANDELQEVRNKLNNEESRFNELNATLEEQNRQHALTLEQHTALLALTEENRQTITDLHNRIQNHKKETTDKHNELAQIRQEIELYGKPLKKLQHHETHTHEWEKDESKDLMIKHTKDFIQNIQVSNYEPITHNDIKAMLGFFIKNGNNSFKVDGFNHVKNLLLEKVAHNKKEVELDREVMVLITEVVKRILNRRKMDKVEIMDRKRWLQRHLPYVLEPWKDGEMKHNWSEAEKQMNQINAKRSQNILKHRDDAMPWLHPPPVPETPPIRHPPPRKVPFTVPTRHVDPSSLQAGTTTFTLPQPAQPTGVPP